MKDRFGNKIAVAWADHELVWVEAALTLPLAERRAAYRDIAAMTTRSLASVQDAGRRVRARDLRQAMAVERKRDKAVMRLPEAWKAMPPSTITPPSMARLMGGRA